jgi:prenyltransferase beta subunit
MLQVARLAPKMLGESKDLVTGFLERQQMDGAFLDRSGNPDLYYTVFGLESLRALSGDLPVESTSAWLRTFDSGAALDLVHLSSLIRCWANVTRVPPPEIADPAAARLNEFEANNLYHCFLALGAYQDLQREPRRPMEFLDCVKRLQSGDGAYANHPGVPHGMTSATAAAIAILRQFGAVVPSGLGDWLLERRHSSGGFFASPSAPIPDLLSTATALHALTSMQIPLDSIRESVLDFLDSLWTARGGFVGSWADNTLDCEYTYYGLLALGHLSL